MRPVHEHSFEPLGNALYKPGYACFCFRLAYVWLSHICMHRLSHANNARHTRGLPAAPRHTRERATVARQLTLLKAALRHEKTRNASHMQNLQRRARRPCWAAETREATISL
eukprot:scaffold26053_cov146-Isochrysis_galbana.AAC.2